MEMKYLLISFFGKLLCLHVVDRESHFSAETFVDKHGETYGKSVESIWQALESRWFLIYTGYRNHIKGDQ